MYVLIFSIKTFFWAKKFICFYYQMLIYLIRHGETDYNKYHKLQGWSDIPLNENGIELAKQTAEGMKDISFDYVFSSPLDRAIKTAEIIVGDKNVTIEKDDRLKEINLAAYEGIDKSLVDNDVNHPMHNYFSNPGQYNPTDGPESFDDVKKRVDEFLNEKVIPLEKKYQKILIVGHGCMNHCIINPILGIGNDNFRKVQLPNCAVSIISLENGKFSVIEKSKVYY